MIKIFCFAKVLLFLDLANPVPVISYWTTSGDNQNRGQVWCKGECQEVCDQKEKRLVVWGTNRGKAL